MIQRCPNCGNWCYAEKKGFWGRVARLFTKNEDSISEGVAEIGEIIGQKGFFRVAGKALNAYCNIFRIPGEAIDGDKYRFYCKECSEQWGTDDDSSDQSAARKLALEATEAITSYNSIASMSKSEQKDYVNNISNLILQISDYPGGILKDYLSSLYDLQAAINYFHFHNSEKAIEYENKSIEIWPDDPNSYALRGEYTTEIQKPLDGYKKIQDIIKFVDADRESPYLSKLEFKTELNNASERYANKFLQIPKFERKYLVIDDELRYLPDSFLVLERSMLSALEAEGLCFPNGYASEKSLYICHPYKTNVYLDAENYKDELFYDQLDELLEILQCLGAKSVDFTDMKTQETTKKEDKVINSAFGGNYKGVGGNINGEYDKSSEYYEKKKLEKFQHLEFPLIPDNTPHVYEGSVWFEHLTTWQTMARMRLRGVEQREVGVSSFTESLIKENEQIKLVADFNTLLAKGNIEGGRKLNFETQEKTSREWKLKVEFYPLSSYNGKVNLASLVVKNGEKTSHYSKRNLTVWVMTGIILALVAIILLFVL